MISMCEKAVAHSFFYFRHCQMSMAYRATPHILHFTGSFLELVIDFRLLFDGHCGSETHGKYYLLWVESNWYFCFVC